MTILERNSGSPRMATAEPPSHHPPRKSGQANSDESKAADIKTPPVELTEVENQFKHILEEFKANAGFSVNTNEPAVDTMVEVLSSKGVMVSLTVLLSYIRYCVNHGIKKDITVKIGYNKPPSVPMNFALNEEMVEDIYPGDVVEIN